MNWLETTAGRISAVVFCVGVLWGLFELYGTLATKDDLKVLKSGILELARCVDDPQYAPGSDRAQREPTCETRVFRAIEEAGGP